MYFCSQRSPGAIKGLTVVSEGRPRWRNVNPPDQKYHGLLTSAKEDVMLRDRFGRSDPDSKSHVRMKFLYKND